MQDELIRIIEHQLHQQRAAVGQPQVCWTRAEASKNVYNTGQNDMAGNPLPAQPYAYPMIGHPPNPNRHHTVAFLGDSIEAAAQQQLQSSIQLLTQSVRPNNDQLVQRTQEQTRQQIQDIIRLSVPDEVKQSYLEAVEKAPDLVAKESDPILFARTCEMDLWSSAKRLCEYWASRKRAFGERAHLPMDLSGRGCMTDTDILNLQAGFPALLPRTKCGKQVVFVDRRQVMPKNLYDKLRANDTGEESGESHENLTKRSPFYLAHLVSQDEKAQTEGVIFLVLLALPRLQDYDRPAQKRGFRALAAAFPLKFQIHLVVCPPSYAAHSHSKRYILQELVTSFIGQLLECSISNQNIHVHFERERGQILEELLEVGLVRDGIPAELGGSWSFQQQWSVWCQEKIQHDLKTSAEHYQAPPKSSGATQQEKNKGLRVKIPDEATLTDGGQSASLTKQQRRKAKNIIHSRQKRARRRQEQASLQQEHERLVKENVRLKMEEKQLGKWWDEAQILISKNAGQQ